MISTTNTGNVFKFFLSKKGGKLTIRGSISEEEEDKKKKKELIEKWDNVRGGT